MLEKPDTASGLLTLVIKLFPEYPDLLLKRKYLPKFLGGEGLSSD